jgi:glycosyltransferase involved in cell wall biosynthesis
MGNMDPLVKGIYDLVPILSELGRMQVPSHLIVAGGRNEILESRIRARGLANKVTFLGWVPHKDCYKLAAASDIFLMVSRRESFGMVTIEAMAMGCVPIANDIPSGSQEIIENKKSGFLLALGDARAWANTIRQLHEDRSHLLLLSQRAQERARYNFSSNRMADDLTVAIDQIFALAKTRVAQRTAGMPIYQGSRPYETTYHKVPPQIRLWLRNFVANFPYISWRLLSR